MIQTDSHGKTYKSHRNFKFNFNVLEKANMMLLTIIHSNIHRGLPSVMLSHDRSHSFLRDLVKRYREGIKVKKEYKPCF